MHGCVHKAWWFAQANLMTFQSPTALIGLNAHTMQRLINVLHVEE